MPVQVYRVVLAKQGSQLRVHQPNPSRPGPPGLLQASGPALGKPGTQFTTAFNQAVEAAKKKLKPADAVILDKSLKANKGEVRAVHVSCRFRYPAIIGHYTSERCCPCSSPTRRCNTDNRSLLCPCRRRHRLPRWRKQSS